jgi:hypothetical protein
VHALEPGRRLALGLHEHGHRWRVGDLDAQAGQVGQQALRLRIGHLLRFRGCGEGLERLVRSLQDLDENRLPGHRRPSAGPPLEARLPDEAHALWKTMNTSLICFGLAHIVRSEK